MRYLVLLFLGLICLSSCKPDRFSHEDKNYLYYWTYNISGDSTLRQFHKPRIVEYRVSGGRHKTSRKNKTHRIYVYKNNSESYESVPIYSSEHPNRCDIVDKAKDAERDGRLLIGIFQESFYPHYELKFIRYK